MYKIPLVYRIAEQFKQEPQPEDSYKEIQKVLRRYSAESIIEIAQSILWNPPTEPLGELRGTPWHTLLLVKWALRDWKVNLRVGPKISRGQFDQLRQMLWELQGTEHKNLKPSNASLMFRSILHVQYEFQRKENWGFIRWSALFSRLRPEHPSRRQFVDVIGIEPDVFIDFVYALYAAILDEKVVITLTWFDPWRLKYGKQVDRMYELISRDVHQLRDELRKDAAWKIQGKFELYEFPYFQRFPFLRTANGLVQCWHRRVFARGMEDAIHFRLSDLGESYTRSFSKVFESYVIELVRESGLNAIEEHEFKEKLGHGSPAVEAILNGEDVNVFVEAKMGLFDDRVVLFDNDRVIYQKTKRIREAISQAWSVGKLLRSGQFEGQPVASAAQDFLLVVLSRELIIGGGEMLKRLYPAGEFEYPDAQSEINLPFSNIFILSIEDFEHLMGCVRSGEGELVKVLKDAVAANSNPKTARMFFSDFLGPYSKRWTDTALIKEARAASEKRMYAIVGESLDMPIPVSD